jgi:hypothetical protein
VEGDLSHKPRCIGAATEIGFTATGTRRPKSFWRVEDTRFIGAGASIVTWSNVSKTLDLSEPTGPGKRKRSRPTFTPCRSELGKLGVQCSFEVEHNRGMRRNSSYHLGIYAVHRNCQHHRRYTEGV